MLPPDIGPHLFTGENWGGTDRIKIDENEFPDGETELFKAEVFQFFCLLHNDAVGDVFNFVVT
jgi:hypothetical protein